MRKTKHTKQATSTNHYHLLPHPEPIRTYTTIVHGQEVEVKVYPKGVGRIEKVKEGYHA